MSARTLGAVAALAAAHACARDALDGADRRRRRRRSDASTAASVTSSQRQTSVSGVASWSTSRGAANSRVQRRAGSAGSASRSRRARPLLPPSRRTARPRLRAASSPARKPTARRERCAARSAAVARPPRRRRATSGRAVDDGRELAEPLVEPVREPERPRELVRRQEAEARRTPRRPRTRARFRAPARPARVDAGDRRPLDRPVSLGPHHRVPAEQRHLRAPQLERHTARPRQHERGIREPHRRRAQWPESRELADRDDLAAGTHDLGRDLDVQRPVPGQEHSPSGQHAVGAHQRLRGAGRHEARAASSREAARRARRRPSRGRAAAGGARRHARRPTREQLSRRRSPPHTWTPRADTDARRLDPGDQRAPVPVLLVEARTRPPTDCRLLVELAAELRALVHEHDLGAPPRRPQRPQRARPARRRATSTSGAIDDGLERARAGATSRSPARSGATVIPSRTRVMHARSRSPSIVITHSWQTPIPQNTPRALAALGDAADPDTGGDQGCRDRVAGRRRRPASPRRSSADRHGADRTHSCALQSCDRSANIAPKPGPHATRPSADHRR